MEADATLKAMRVAALPMYDLPETVQATDELWSAISKRLRAFGVEGVPDVLERGGDPRDVWNSQRLLFTQTCGFPLMHEFAGKLALVATPCYDAIGCEGPSYRSFIIVRADDRRASFAEFVKAVVAINSEDSHSGFNILRWRVAREGRGGIFARVERTGSHFASLDAVRSGRADLAAIDCVTFGLLKRHRPSAVMDLRVLEQTPSAPALPFVTARATTEEELRLLRQALAETLADPALSEVRGTLLLRGAEEVPLTRYETIRDFARQGAGVTLD